MSTGRHRERCPCWFRDVVERAAKSFSRRSLGPCGYTEETVKVLKENILSSNDGMQPG